MAETRGNDLPAPHALRILAWLVDLLVVSAVLLFLPQPLSYLLFLLLLISYHSLLTWLVGETLGKALLGLRVARLTGDRGFLWSVGRSGLGYFVVDVFGLGCLIAPFNRWHRCLHDYAFNSVVLFDGSRPTNLQQLMDRLERYAERQQEAIKAKKKPLAVLSAFWASLEYIGSAVQRLLRLIAHPGHAAPAGTGSVAAVVSAKAVAVIVAVGTAATAAIVAAVPPVRDAAAILVQPRFLWRASDGVLPLDDKVVALLEFDGSAADSSDHGRAATLIGGAYVETDLGMGLRVPATGAAGIDWTDHVSLLSAPYTVEIILTPSETTPWGKLFGFDDSDDNGWYYKNGGIQSYPHQVLGEGSLPAGHRHYLAFVVRADDVMTVYAQGAKIGETSPGFASPPVQALFFRDDAATGRREQLEAVIDALRISNVARSAEEIMAIGSELGLE